LELSKTKKLFLIPRWFWGEGETAVWGVHLIPLQMSNFCAFLSLGYFLPFAFGSGGEARRLGGGCGGGASGRTFDSIVHQQF